MTDNIQKKGNTEKTFNNHVDRCLSMILHHEEVQQIAQVIKNVLEKKNGAETK